MHEPQRTATSDPGAQKFSGGRLRYLYRSRVVARQREEAFLIAVSFGATFGLVRFITHSIRDHRFRRIFRNLSGRGGRHLHHLVFGIMGLLLTGYLSSARRAERAGGTRVIAAAYGSSAALTVDEFALWLNLEDVYWSSEGRISVDAAVLTGALMVVGAEGRDLFTALAHDAVAVGRDLWAAMRKLA